MLERALRLSGRSPVKELKEISLVQGQLHMSNEAKQGLNSRQSKNLNCACNVE